MYDTGVRITVIIFIFVLQDGLKSLSSPAIGGELAGRDELEKLLTCIANTRCRLVHSRSVKGGRLGEKKTVNED